jgi:trans-aconitate methyltransferase
VFAFSSFAWIKKQQKALINIANALAPNGQFIAGIAHEDSPYLRVRFKIMNSKKWENYFVGYELPFYPLNEDKIKDLCKNAGLTFVDTTRRDRPYTFENREAFIQFMRALPAQLNQIPDERQEEFLNDIIDDYLKDVPRNQTGGIELLLSGLLVIAKK